VEEGQLLAKLDTSEWEEQLKVLEDQVTAAERQLTSSERSMTTKELDLLQAGINLTNAEIALEQTNTTYSLSDFKVAQADVDEAEENLEATLKKWSDYGEGTPGYKAFREVVIQAQARLDTAEAQLEAMSSGFDTEEIAIKKLQVEIAQGKLEDARIAIEDAQIAIEDAQEDFWDAQEELDEAKSDSPEITAPFAGFITLVNVEGGDEVLKGTVAVELADPTKFEADVLVNEMDILQVRLGGEATIQVDAMQMITLPARVTHISPSATIQSGVVNYRVKVEIQSLEATVQERQEARQESMPDITSGELPMRLQQAIEEGRLTREQADEMMRQRQTGDFPSPSDGGVGPALAKLPEDFQLREGLTVTVSIIMDERNDVLLVPNSAITTQKGQTYVQVLSGNSTTEEREISTGISDFQFTEVIEGLSEGNQVVVPQGTTTSNAATPQQGGTSIRIPGIGRTGR
ncbi:HlyD family efflux transporter periplasmic adaptor subunit, partial [Chloroflexota bacterium]